WTRSRTPPRARRASAARCALGATCWWRGRRRTRASGASPTRPRGARRRRAAGAGGACSTGNQPVSAHRRARVSGDNRSSTLSASKAHRSAPASQSIRRERPQQGGHSFLCRARQSRQGVSHKAARK
ncbi:MAG: hypothetical protein J3K34DRAFT_526844, partial [Monoraphidium minutum]